MRFEPSLALERLLITKGGSAAYDQLFHPGVNIIRGENGSGKSTIADFIFFALGGDVTKWRNAAARCDFVHAQVALNGEQMTLRREISSQQHRPMSIFWGNLESAQDVEGWQVFPFSSLGSKESFSQVLFSSLRLPEVLRGDSDTRVTMHQLLRLLYVDQKSPYDELFFNEEFDSPVTRGATGDLVLGTYDDELYRKKIGLREMKRQLSGVRAELEGISTVLGETSSSIQASLIEMQIQEAQKERQELIDRLSEQDEEPRAEDAKLTEAEVEMGDLKKKLVKQRGRIREMEREVERKRYEIEDSAQFIRGLERRLIALDDAEAVGAALGTAVFTFCPSCYQPLEEREEGICVVCKRTFDNDQRPNLLRLRHELSMQLKESGSLQDRRREGFADLVEILPAERRRLQRLQAALDELGQGSVTSAERRRAKLHRRLGYLDNQLEHLDERLELAKALETLEARRRSLLGVIEETEKEVRSREKRVKDRGQEAAEMISAITVELLQDDLPRERLFQKAEYVSFDFGHNSLAVDGRNNFAASSMVYLKNAFHLAVLLASLQKSYMRHPRFVLFDCIEDKGMEPARSHNFQMQVVDRSELQDVTHQIVMTTSMVSPELNESDWVIGPYYTHDRRTLDI